MTQPTLWDLARTFPPASSPSDPDTSREAEAAVTTSGRRQAHCEAVLALVRRLPGSTSVELYEAQRGPGGLERHEVSRRLADLLRAGKVRQGEARACAVRGTRMVTWRVV